MCGTVGYVGPKDVVSVVLEGLRRLEYRGYDSAGIGVGNAGHGLELRRASGKLRNLEEVIRQHPLNGTYGVGHTRWATHGRPTEENAHPHRDRTGRIVVVHNGIVENYLELKRELEGEGHTFVTETDTEVIAHLIEQEMRSAECVGKTMLLEDAVRRAVRRLTGAYAISVIYFLADGDVAILTPQDVKFTNLDGTPVERKVEKILWDPIQAEKGGYKHFMLKEIWEQPRAVRDTTLGRISHDTGDIFLGEMKIIDDQFRAATQINVAACGTSWHSALAGKYMIERLARIPVEVDYASEYRYRDPIADPRALGLLITQSDETADTLAAQREMIAKGSMTIAICNVVGSMVAREAHGTIYTHAGPEIGVASTKAFTAQLTALFLFALHLALKRGLRARKAWRWSTS
jgi:glutamine---fructose-6-phosphate transaminase (isomerizing)